MKKSDIGIQIIPDEFGTTFVIQGEQFEDFPWFHLEDNKHGFIEQIHIFDLTKDDCKALARLFDAVGSWL